MNPVDEEFFGLSGGGIVEGMGVADSIWCQICDFE